MRIVKAIGATLIALATGSPMLASASEHFKQSASMPTLRQNAESDTVDGFEAAHLNTIAIEGGKVAATERPRLTIGSYNRAQGLIAVYQSEAGKRLLFEARHQPDGTIIAQIFQRDLATGKIVPIVVRGSVQGSLRAASDHLEVAGVNLHSLLNGKALASSSHEQNERLLAQFLKGETGQAILDGLPALYAGLEQFEATPDVADLVAPFGAIAMALQVSTKEYRGFKNADKVIGATRDQALRDACRGVDDCLMRGKTFMVHHSGLFNVLSKHKGASLAKREQLNASPPAPAVLENFRRPNGVAEFIQQLAQAQQSTAGQDRQKDLDGRCRSESMNAACFGLCGPGCTTPGNVATAECFGHDYCVCAYGYAACATSVPQDCGLEQGVNCYNLFEAAGSFFSDLGSSFWAWFTGNSNSNAEEEQRERERNWSIT
jgi:hypothetical protein